MFLQNTLVLISWPPRVGLPKYFLFLKNFNKEKQKFCVFSIFLEHRKYITYVLRRTVTASYYPLI